MTLWRLAVKNTSLSVWFLIQLLLNALHSVWGFFWWQNKYRLWKVFPSAVQVAWILLGTSLQLSFIEELVGNLENGRMRPERDALEGVFWKLEQILSVTLRIAFWLTCSCAAAWSRSSYCRRHHSSGKEGNRSSSAPRGTFLQTAQYFKQYISK